MTDEDIQSIVEERDELALLCTALMLDIEHNLGTENAKKIWNTELIRTEMYLHATKISDSVTPLEKLKAQWGKGV